MKSLNSWFEEYALSHQNDLNKKIHYICVPAIYLSLIGMLLCVKLTFLNLKLPFVENFAFVILVFVLFFYARISKKMALKMFAFSIFCFCLNFYVEAYFNLLYVSITIFVTAWIGQFYGHKIEGVKPSFLKDIQFLLIGPAWVIENLFSKKKS